jgi:hypothetical protein
MDRSWVAAWCFALLICVAAAAGYEAYLRGMKYFPMVQDDADLWSMQLDVVKAHPRAVVLLGASRIEYGVDPVLLSHELGGCTVSMLAVNGAYPLAVLRMLADDDRFAGLAIVGIDARGLSRSNWDMQLGFVEHYKHRWTLARRIHRELLTRIQRSLVLASSRFSAVSLLQKLAEGHALPVNNYYYLIRENRSGAIDYRRSDTPAIRAARVADLAASYRQSTPPDPEAWHRDLAPIHDWVRRIEQHGGRVVFFREPVGGESLALDEANYPRSLYWDAFARESPGTVVDFRDLPDFTGLELPDTSHIDGTDVPRFTAALARVLKGVEAKGGPPLCDAPTAIGSR